MLQLLKPAARGIAAATIVSAFALAAPLYAATTDQPQLMAQANQAPSSSTPATGAAQAPAQSSMARHIDEHIKRLHDELKITPAQEQQWDAVAQVMRGNAEAMHTAIEQRRQAKNLSAVEDLKAYESITEVHAQGLQKLIPAFQTLYDTMSPDQKKIADTTFSRTRHGHRHRKGAHGSEAKTPSNNATTGQ